MYAYINTYLYYVYSRVYVCVLLEYIYIYILASHHKYANNGSACRISRARYCDFVIPWDTLVLELPYQTKYIPMYSYIASLEHISI